MSGGFTAPVYVLRSDFEEQRRSGFRYHFSNHQMEYSRNLIFMKVGGRMEQVFQALIDRSRGLLDLKTIQTILGDKGRPKYRPRNMRAASRMGSRRSRYLRMI